MRILNSCVIYKFQAVDLLIDCCSTRNSRSLVFSQLWTALTWHWVCSTPLS